MAEVPKQIGELAAKNPNDKTRLQREIDAIDRQIAQLVNELYGLSAEDVKIAEAASPGLCLD